MALTAPSVGGYSAFWQTTGDKSPYWMPQSQGRAKDAWHIARFMRGHTTRDAAAALAVLIGAAPGASIDYRMWAVPNAGGPSLPVPQVTGVAELGGLRTAVQPAAVASLNPRVTTAADVTELKKWFSTALLEAGITYPVATGSGGGGKMKAGMSSFV